MIKWLLKLMMPKTDELAKMISEVVAKTINESDKTEVIKKYAPTANKITEVQTILVKWFEDGKLDEDEQKQMANALTPIIEHAVKEVLK